MKVNGIELNDAGYKRKEDDSAAVPSLSMTKEKSYATINSNDKEMPLGLSGIKSGDKLMLVCLVNVKEITSTDNKKKDEPRERFTFEILKCGAEKSSEKAPEEMSDDELNESAKG